ncbi:hypothetical protein ACFWAR_22470 [Streptomyces sp. NPDC059917]|uniref:hypothetical protein n=1 Tax=Streptomyces sp. NPDC059917 TaxID=3347002 RepID=UPI00365A7551
MAGAAGAATAALLTGCSGGADAPEAAEVPPERPLREGAVRDSEALLERYDATVAAHPSLAPRLAPLRAAVAAHVGALAPDDGRGKASASPSAAAPTGPGPGTGAAGNPPGKTPGKGAEPVPAQPAEAVTALATAERDLAEARTIALAGASGELARLLASVAACGAVHTYLLSQNPGGKA